MSFSANSQREAELTYAGGDYHIVRHGDYVTCAVTGARIPLDDLKYWSVARQEAYATCAISYERELQCNPEMRKALGKAD